MAKKFTNHNVIIFLALMIIGLTINSLFLGNHYSLDAYFVEKNQDEMMINIQSSLGRPLIVFFGILFKFLNIKVMEHQVLLMIIAQVFLSLSALLVVTKILPDNREKKSAIIILICASLLITNNIFNIELLSHIYLAVFSSLAVLLNVLAARIVSEKQTLTKYLLSCVLVTCSLCLYQGWGALFLPLVLVFYLLEKNYSIIILLKRIVIFTSIYLFACIINLIYLKVIHPHFFGNIEHRAENNINIISNIITIIKIQKNIWLYHDYLLPKYFFMISVIVLILISISIIIKNKLKLTFNLLISAFIVMLICILPFMPHLITATVWAVPRTIPVISALPGFLILISLIFIQDSSKTFNNNMHSITLLVSVIIFMRIIVSTTQIESDQIATNKIDEEMATLIVNTIQVKEKELNTTVTKLSFIQDKNPKYMYKDIKGFGDLNVRAMVIDWTAKILISNISNKAYQITEFDKDIYDDYFKDKNWDFFSPDQIIIKDNVAYIAMF
ncbi:glucosyltransferase domain-containing protein [Paenibacillus sp. GCM10023248]|uniref:glucosyltransferase domain-containing protein n=1 Tax=unclassified Paenibacillus TaxID=185978 RepID=UPI002379E8AD|nr:glucosyltransferase domain-containing protein [Paenibacillus sp. MAHUQ-63]MDD9266611.1 glucosyltransferase domain-containing protein [Paenibacillus sp. MAHUQ-63]